jgi:hypothetical protein
MRFVPICLLGLGCLLGACEATSHRIQGTDVPKIPGTTLVQSSFQSSGGRVQAGEATFSGSIYDAMERARWAGRGFKQDGWTRQSLTGSPTKATAVFTAPWTGEGLHRVATLEITASQLRGAATITVTVEPTSDTKQAEPAKGSSDDAGAKVAPEQAMTTASDDDAGGTP